MWQGGGPVYFEGGNTIKNVLVALKDRDKITWKSGVIYRYKCDNLDYDEDYIGKSARNCGESLREYLTAPLPIYTDANIMNHCISVDNFSIVVGRHTTPQGPSRRPCTSKSVVHPSIGTLARSSCPTYGMRFCLISMPPP